MRALIHGNPGTGKSRVITWIWRLFMEAREWTHGVQFLCVAFQNKVAHAMGGSTLHSDMHVFFETGVFHTAEHFFLVDCHI